MTTTHTKHGQAEFSRVGLNESITDAFDCDHLFAAPLVPPEMADLLDLLDLMDRYVEGPFFGHPDDPVDIGLHAPPPDSDHSGPDSSAELELDLEPLFFPPGRYRIDSSLPIEFSDATSETQATDD